MRSIQYWRQPRRRYPDRPCMLKPEQGYLSEQIGRRVRHGAVPPMSTCTWKTMHSVS